MSLRGDVRIFLSACLPLLLVSHSSLPPSLAPCSLAGFLVGRLVSGRLFFRASI